MTDIDQKIEKLLEVSRESVKCRHVFLDKKIESNESYRKQMNSYCDEILKHCDADIIDYLKTKPDSVKLHFGLGLWIRNNYIYKGLMHTLAPNADEESDEIIYYLIKYVCGEIKE